MRKRIDRTHEEKSNLQDLIINKSPSKEQLITLLAAAHSQIDGLSAQITTYEEEIREWRKGRRMRIFLRIYWEAYFEDSTDNKTWNIDQYRRWHDNLCRYVQENWGYFNLKE